MVERWVGSLLGSVTYLVTTVACITASDLSSLRVATSLQKQEHQSYGVSLPLPPSGFISGKPLGLADEFALAADLA